MLIILCIFASVGVASLVVTNLCLIALHFVYAKASRVQEARTLSIEVTENPAETICVQLPVRNEVAVIGETLQSICRLDWPREQLEIQVLDDNSDDGTVDIAHSEAAKWRQLGINVRIISASERVTKGELLRRGMSLSNAKYFAVFDADYRPEPDFLRLLMKFFGESPWIGFVQARLDFRNRNATWITRAQALDLDTYYAFDQIGRTWGNIPVAYNGTCGVWRRAALEDAGGWTPRSFLEDVDASFRSFKKGWYGRFVTSVTVPGHLPETASQFATQRLRWTIGWHQQFAVMPLKAVLKVGPAQAFFFALLFILDTCGPLLVALNMLLLASVFLIDESNFGTGLSVFLLSVALVLSTRAAGTLLAVKQCGRSISGTTFTDLFRVWALYLVMLPISLLAVASMLSRSIPKFEQTPKSG